MMDDESEKKWKDILSCHLFGATDEYHSNPHENRRPFRDLNREPSEPMSRALPLDHSLRSGTVCDEICF